MGILEILFIVFVTLKLMGTIDWSWWLVCAPLYPSAILLAITAWIITRA